MGLSSLRFRHLAGATVAGTFALILLGIYTAAVGAGLACEARWPLCDGWMGLFPANWPSFVEWFHRLVAMLVGFMILGTWLSSWRRGASRRGLVALSVAVALLPIQIWLGAETVLSYESLYLIAHFSTALIIFTGILLGAVWTAGYDGVGAARVPVVLGGMLGLLAPFFGLTPGFLVVHSPELQLAYYGIGLGLFTAAVLVGVSSWSGGRRPLVPALAGLSAVLIGVQLVAGRLVRTDLVAAVDWASGAVLVAVLLGALWAALRAGRADRPPASALTE